MIVASRNGDIIGTLGEKSSVLPADTEYITFSLSARYKKARMDAGPSAMGTFQARGTEHDTSAAKHAIGTFMGHIGHRRQTIVPKSCQSCHAMPIRSDRTYGATATDMKQDINRTSKGHETGIRGQTPHIRLTGNGSQTAHRQIGNGDIMGTFLSRGPRLTRCTLRAIGERGSVLCKVEEYAPYMPHMPHAPRTATPTGIASLHRSAPVSMQDRGWQEGIIK